MHILSFRLCLLSIVYRFDVSMTFSVMPAFLRSLIREIGLGLGRFCNVQYGTCLLLILVVTAFDLARVNAHWLGEFPPYVAFARYREVIASLIEFYWDRAMEVEHEAGEFFANLSEDFWTEFRRACRDPYGEQGILRYAENFASAWEIIERNSSFIIGFLHKIRRLWR
jgi:hypothetical protein